MLAYMQLKLWDIACVSLLINPSVHGRHLYVLQPVMGVMDLVLPPADTRPVDGVRLLEGVAEAGSAAAAPAFAAPRCATLTQPGPA